MKFDYELLWQIIMVFLSLLLFASYIGYIYLTIVFTRYVYTYFSTGEWPKSPEWKFWKNWKKE